MSNLHYIATATHHGMSSTWSRRLIILHPAPTISGLCQISNRTVHLTLKTAGHALIDYVLTGVEHPRLRQARAPDSPARCPRHDDDRQRYSKRLLSAVAVTILWQKIAPLNVPTHA